MKNEKLGQDPATPIIFRKIGDNEFRIATPKDLLDVHATLKCGYGISIRLKIATEIAGNLLAKNGVYKSSTQGDDYDNLSGYIPCELAKEAYAFADELLKQENQ